MLSIYDKKKGVQVTGALCQQLIGVVQMNVVQIPPTAPGVETDHVKNILDRAVTILAKAAKDIQELAEMMFECRDIAVRKTIFLPIHMHAHVSVSRHMILSSSITCL